MQVDNDRELLRLAAKAAGLFSKHPDFDLVLKWEWNPLIEDGDAFRLMTKLSLVPDFRPHYKVGIVGHVKIEEFGGADLNKALRRAIVMAAAEIGGTLK
jgi:hypothetical protein